MPDTMSGSCGRMIDGVNVLISYTRMMPSRPPVMICVVSSLKQQLVTWNAWGSVFTHSCDRSSQSYVLNELNGHFARAVIAAAHQKTIVFLGRVDAVHERGMALQFSLHTTQLA